MAKKELKLCLVGKDGNAYALLGYFRAEAKRAGWSKEEIQEVMEEATRRDYNHLILTLIEQ